MQAADTLIAGANEHGMEYDPVQVAEEGPSAPLTTTSSIASLDEESIQRGPQYEPTRPASFSSSPDFKSIERGPNYEPTRPAPHYRTETGVSVVRAEAEFAELSRELSGISQDSKMLERSVSRRSWRSKSEKEVDVERVGTRESQRFDLESTLRGQRELDLEVGIRSKRIGVLWDNLRVSGLGGVRNYVKTFPDSFVSFFNIPGTIMTLLGVKRKGKEFDILKGFRGLAKPGEMVLVLGKPSSGCTTFLKVIANQRFGYTKVDGEVLYGPYDAETFGKKYRGEAVYNQEDDIQ